MHLPFHLAILSHQHPRQQRAIKPRQNQFQSQLTDQVQLQDSHFRIWLKKFCFRLRITANRRDTSCGWPIGAGRRMALDGFHHPLQDTTYLRRNFDHWSACSDGIALLRQSTGRSRSDLGNTILGKRATTKGNSKWRQFTCPRSSAWKLWKMTLLSSTWQRK